MQERPSRRNRGWVFRDPLRQETVCLARMCEAMLTEHSLQEGSPALPVLQDLGEGCSLQARTSGSSY